MTRSVRESPIAVLFRWPHSLLWVPAFAALAMSDPVAAEVLGIFIGPETETVEVEGRRRAKVPGELHFLRTWVLIMAEFLGMDPGSLLERTNADHVRTSIRADLLALPIRWIVVLAADTAAELGKPELYEHLQAAAIRFADDIGADPTVLGVTLEEARAEIAEHFRDVIVPEPPGHAFWLAMDTGNVRETLGGTPGHVDVTAIQQSLERHLPAELATQFMAYAPFV